MANIADLVAQLDPESGLQQLFEDRWNEQEAHAKNLAQKVEQLTIKCNSISQDFEVSLLKNVQLQQDMEDLHSKVQMGDVFREACSESFDQQVRARMQVDEIDYIDAVGLIVAEMQQERQLQAAKLQRVLAENQQYKNDILTNVPIFNAIKQDPKLNLLAKFLTAPPQLLPDMRECVTFLQASQEEQQQKLATALQQLDNLTHMYQQQNEVVKSAEQEANANKQEKAIVAQQLQGDVEAKSQHIKELEQALKRMDDDYQSALQQIQEFQKQLEALQEGLKTGSVYAGSSACADQFLQRLAPGKDFIDAVLQDEQEIADEKRRIEDLYQAAEKELEMIRDSDVFKASGVQFKADVPAAQVLENHLLDVQKQLENSVLATLAAKDAAEAANGQIESMQTEKAALEAEQQETQRWLQQLQEKLARQQEECKMTNEALESAKAESAEQLDELNVKNRELERKISELALENEQMQLDIENANQQIEAKQAEIGEFQGLIAQKAAQVAIQERRIEDLEDAMQALRDDARSGELFRPTHAAFVEKVRECAAELQKQGGATPATGAGVLQKEPAANQKADREAAASGGSAASIQQGCEKSQDSSFSGTAENGADGAAATRPEDAVQSSQSTLLGNITGNLQEAALESAESAFRGIPQNSGRRSQRSSARNDQAGFSDAQGQDQLVRSGEPKQLMHQEEMGEINQLQDSQGAQALQDAQDQQTLQDQQAQEAQQPQLNAQDSQASQLLKALKTPKTPRSPAPRDFDFLSAAEALLAARECENEALRASEAALREKQQAVQNEVERNVPFFRKLQDPQNLQHLLSPQAAQAFRASLQRPETLFDDIARYLANQQTQTARAEQSFKQSEQRFKSLHADFQEAKAALLAKEQAILHHQNAAEQALKQAQIARMNSRHYCLAGLSNLNQISQIMILNKELARRQDEQMCIIIQNVAILSNAIEGLQASQNTTAAFQQQHARALEAACERAQKAIYASQVREDQLTRQTAVLRKQCAVLEAQSLRSQLGGEELYAGEAGFEQLSREFDV